MKYCATSKHEFFWCSEGFFEKLKEMEEKEWNSLSEEEKQRRIKRKAEQEAEEARERALEKGMHYIEYIEMWRERIQVLKSGPSLPVEPIWMSGEPSLPTEEKIVWYEEQIAEYESKLEELKAIHNLTNEYIKTWNDELEIPF